MALIDKDKAVLAISMYLFINDAVTDRVPNRRVSDYDTFARSILADVPEVDIVRCQDCKYWVYHFNGCSRNPCTEPWYAEDFCNYGERSE